MTDLATWTGLVDNDATSGTFVRELYISGDMPIPEKNTFNWKGVDYVKNRDYTYNFDIIDANQQNYDFVRESGCQLDVWFAFDTDGGSLFGWIRGVLDLDVELLRGTDSLETYKGSITWTHTCPPPRFDSPFVS